MYCLVIGVRSGCLPLVTLVLVQCADAGLTAVGIDRFGSAVEANPIVAWYAQTLGVGGALLGVKAVAVGCATTLHLHGRYRTLCALSALYVLVAIIPWMVALWT